jgi:hypothetical protein
MTRRFAAVALSLLFAAASPAAQAVVSVEVAGNTATAEISLPGGIEAELILTFDQASNLSANALGISAQSVNLNDPALLARLPPGGLASLPAALPLLVTVEPPTLGGLSLNNTVRAELHTHALPYTAGSSFRLFKAPLNGAFRDITDEVAPGSVRTRGTTGGFSQFLVLLDLRPTGSVVDEKLAWLRSRLAALPEAERQPLAAQLDGAESAVDAGQFANAIALLDAFRARVSARAGQHIPNSWTPAQREANVAGDLLGGAASLRFSVGYLRDYGG